MSTLFISLLTLVLLLVSAFVILIVLMQRSSQSGGMGAALGGGAAESAFGSETNSILTKGTIYGIITFFLVALALYLIYQSQASSGAQRLDPASLVGSDTVEGVEGVEGLEGVEGESSTLELESMGSTEESSGASAGQSSVMVPDEDATNSVLPSISEENAVRIETE